MAETVKVANKSEIGPGSAKAVEASGRRIAVFNVDGNYYAIDDTCTHRGGPLSMGMVQGTRVICPWHGANFDLITGNVLAPPAPTDVASYRVQIDGDEIKVEIP